jgi:hypothetical protein
MFKKICPRCQGNGFIKVKESIENPIDIVQQCTQCNSQGEIMIDVTYKNIEKERYLLSVAHIKKLEEEIDMLRKQKIYLQSKLREKESNDKEGIVKIMTYLINGLKVLIVKVIKPVRSEYVKDLVQKLLWITLLITIFMLALIPMETSNINIMIQLENILATIRTK